MESLERKFRDLLADWDATYEKFAKLNARLAKRAKRELEALEHDNAAPNGPAEAITQPGGTFVPPVDANPRALALLGRRS